MSRHDDSIRLRHMLDHAVEAVEMCQHRARPDLDSDRMLNLSLVRLVEIVGEAGNRVSKDRQLTIPEIPWSEIIGMRNRILHGYDSVDFDILWVVVREDLPKLIATLQKSFGIE